MTKEPQHSPPLQQQLHEAEEEMRYRRAHAGGGVYFFTVNLAQRKRPLLAEHIALLGMAIRKVRARHPFHIDALVVLPDHLHAVWTLPEGDVDYSMRWALIKSGFSRCLPKNEPHSRSRVAKGERGIWQRRYWEHLIRNEEDYAHHVDYCYFNPVKHGYVKQVSDWPYSTFHRDVRSGLYPLDWVACPTSISTQSIGWGER